MSSLIKKKQPIMHTKLNKVTVATTLALTHIAFAGAPHSDVILTVNNNAITTNTETLEGTTPTRVFGSDFINMLGFDYKLNAEKILKRVEELKNVKELQEKQFKEQEKFRRKLKGEPEGWFARQLWRLGFKRNK